MATVVRMLYIGHPELELPQQKLRLAGTMEISLSNSPPVSSSLLCRLVVCSPPRTSSSAGSVYLLRYLKNLKKKNQLSILKGLSLALAIG